MSLNLHPFFMAEKNALATDGQWVWLYEVEVPTTPPTRYRFAKNNQEVRFRGNLYYPFPVTHTVLKQTESGSLPSLTMTVSNVSREVMATLEAHGGLIGQPVRLILTNLRAITSNQSVIEHDFKIISVSATDLAVAAALGDVSMYENFFPAQRMMRHACRHQYRSAGCGYSVAATDTTNYLSTCDKTLDGPNGCRVHGTSETAAGVAVVHPGRFGGFTGIPTPTTEGSI